MTDKPTLEDLTETQIPEPVGYKILVVLPDIEEKFTNSRLLRPDQVLREEQHASMVAIVLGVGPDAYSDQKRFPSGPWCKEGDKVIINPYSGTRMQVAGRHFRMINDDSVIGKIEDPTYFERG
jgi:co-chaperonin GroES (HSP10)